MIKFALFKLFSMISDSLYKSIVYNMERIYSTWVRSRIGQCAENIHVKYPAEIKGGQYMKIGNLFAALPNLRLECWDEFCGDFFSPELVIGENVSVNTNLHIGCINSITIGSNTLIGSNVCIIDHQHGYVDNRDFMITPSMRPLTSKGAIKIGEGVWIGENVVILPNVTIGDYAVIGANSVVTHDVKANAVACGIPAKEISSLRRMQKESQ